MMDNPVPYDVESPHIDGSTRVRQGGKCIRKYDYRYDTSATAVDDGDGDYIVVLHDLHTNGLSWGIAAIATIKKVSYNFCGTLLLKAYRILYTQNIFSSTEKTPPWRDIILEYTQQTTFHGVRFITSKTRYPVRRYVFFFSVK